MPRDCGSLSRVAVPRSPPEPNKTGGLTAVRQPAIRVPGASLLDRRPPHCWTGVCTFACEDGPTRFAGAVGAIQLRGKQLTLTLGEAGPISYGEAIPKSETPKAVTARQ